MRSVNTSLVVLLPILSLLLFGGATLKDFAFAMFIGVAIGAYSSIFIAAPVLTDPEGARAAVPAARGSPGGRARRAARKCVRHGGGTAAARRPRRTSDAAATRATARQGPRSARHARRARSGRPPSGSGGRRVEIEDIKALIRDVPDFPEPGIVFRDITPVLADPIAFSTITDLIVVHFGRGNVDKVVGIEARGFILASPVAYHFGAGFVPIRKQGKLPWETAVGVEYELEYGKATLELHTRRHRARREGTHRRRRPGHRGNGSCRGPAG